MNSVVKNLYYNPVHQIEIALLDNIESLKFDDKLKYLQMNVLNEALFIVNELLQLSTNRPKI